MAATKKSAEINRHKQQYIEAINKIREEISSNPVVVPKEIINGSHQDAVMWKRMIDKAASGIKAPPTRATLGKLRELSQRAERSLAFLRGEASYL